MVALYRRVSVKWLSIIIYIVELIGFFPKIYRECATENVEDMYIPVWFII